MAPAIVTAEQAPQAGAVAMPPSFPRLSNRVPDLPPGSTAFHVTEIENVGAILREGLIPQIGERSRELGEPTPAVYAFPTAQACHDALGSWLGEWFEDKEEATGQPVELAILVLDTSGLAPAEQEVAWEVRFLESVPAPAIRGVLSECAFGEWWYETCREQAA